MIFDDIDLMLKEYFRWAKASDPSDIGFPHAEPTQRLRGSTVKSVCLSDDEALWIDRALSSLNVEYPSSHHIILRIYRDGYSPRKLETMGEGGRETIKFHANFGKDYIKKALLE